MIYEITLISLGIAIGFAITQLYYECKEIKTDKKNE